MFHPLSASYEDVGKSYTWTMKVLIVGEGGREHALAWKIKQSPKVKKIFVAPGNPGTASIATNIACHTVDEILAWVKQNPVDLVVIGPDKYLAEGLTDALQKIGTAVFGPTKAAAETEWSKSYAKQFMQEEGIPTARHRVFESAEGALDYIRKQLFPLVIKADGLAAGKGVIIAKTLVEAEQAVQDMMEKKIHGNSGARIVVEDFLEGLEISIHAFCDGETAILFPSSKDHKRIFENDEGLNTGGMGTIAPVPFVPEEQMNLILERVVLPTLAGLKKRGRPFSGILFPGIMLTKYGPMVIEFNARFGDPETQSYMRLLDSDLFDILYACTNATLKEAEVHWRSESACCVVLASEGYPEKYKKDVPIGLSKFDSEDVVIFHAGTTIQDGKLITKGGRVFGLTTTGPTLKEALDSAYEEIEHVQFSGKQFRRDIGTSVPQ
jgi:phosphoribosylamine--glycine ligase